MKITKKRLTIVLSLAAGSLHAASRGGDIYSIAADTADQGGARSSYGTLYTGDASVGGIAGVADVVAPVTAIAHGFMGQIVDDGMANAAPTEVALSATSIAENTAPDSAVGSFSAADANESDTFTYALVSGAGDTDNTSFAITGNTLTLHIPADFEVQSSYAIRVRATDRGGLFFDKEFTISITNVNEAPVASDATYTRAVGTSLKINIAALLAASTSDPDGDARTLESVGASAQGAAITTNATQILYSPANNNDDGFSYTIGDGHSHTATATIHVHAVPQEGKVVNFTRNDNNQPMMRFAGIPGYRYSIERSTDLSQWSVIQTFNAPATGVTTFTDPTDPPLKSAFYRMRYNP